MAQIGRKHSVIKQRMTKFHPKKQTKQTLTGKMFGRAKPTNNKAPKKSSESFVKKAYEVASKSEVRAARHWIGNRLRDWGRGAIR